MRKADLSNDVSVTTIRNEFLFGANRPDHAAAVASQIARIPNGRSLNFESAVLYQNSHGGLSRIVVKYVSPARTVVVESRPSVNGPAAEIILDETVTTFQPNSTSR